MSAIAPGVVFEVNNFAVTNTMLAGIITLLIMVFLAIAVRISLSIRPNKLQSFVEILYEYIYSLTENISDKKRAKMFFPWIMGFFTFILISNYIGLLPLFGESFVIHPKNEIVYDIKTGNKDRVNLKDTQDENVELKSENEHEEYPFLRGATTDMNYTFAMALVSFVLIIGYGVLIQNPIGFILHYFQANELKKMEKSMMFAMIPLFAFVGVLEIILEPLKSISLSFRLFGNVYAGETLIYAMSTIANGDPTLFIVIPFYLLEFLIAFIQALVFATLTLVFLSLVTAKH